MSKTFVSLFWTLLMNVLPAFLICSESHLISLTERRKKKAPGPPPGPPPELSDSEPEEEEYDPATGEALLRL